jgi:hypothetical protein
MEAQQPPAVDRRPQLHVRARRPVQARRRHRHPGQDGASKVRVRRAAEGRAPADSPRKQAVSTHAQELEALEAKLRETEERLKMARNSPPRRKDSQRRTPIESTFPQNDSPLRQKEDAGARDAKGALSGSPSSDNSTEYVLVDRPRTARTEDGQRA